MNKTVVIYCTRGEDKAVHNITDPSVVIVPVINNTRSLPVVYNEYIELYKDTDCNMVLMHDDVVITDDQFVEKVDEGLRNYGVIGLAGGTPDSIRRPCLWHIMSPRDTFRGEVQHIDDNSVVFNTRFGPQGRVLMLDGLFIAFNPRIIHERCIKFDESNPCISHFYDLDFSLRANSRRLTLGTIPLSVIHRSPGLRSYTQDWLTGQEWFYNRVYSGVYNT